MMKKNIFVFHINIEDSDPGIWRALRVPGEFTLEDLHGAIQIAFGWTNSHLHSFTLKGVEYAMAPMPGMDLYKEEDTLLEDEYCLDDFNLRKKQSFSYLYDFGDSWEHTITVSEVLPFSEDEAAPLCLGGEYAGPLEDSGGIWGYAEILEILKDPRHEEYNETLEWTGDFDPLAFDAEKVNKSLKKAFKPVRAVKAGKKPVEKKKPDSGSSSPEAPKKAGNSGGKGPPDGKLKKLCALMGRVKELKPWEKLWDTDFVLIEFPDQEEPVLCSVMGKEEYSFGIAVYPGFASIMSLFRMLDSESENPLVFLGYQDCLLCHLGQRDELFPEERARLKELGISFRGKHDWVYFRKAVPGYSPWYINSKDADILIEVLTRFIDAYTSFEGGLKVNFEDDQIISHRYSENDGKWITLAGKIPLIPAKIEEFTVDSGDVEPLRFKKQLKTTAEAETLYFPMTMGISENGVPILMRVNILIDNKTGVILDQNILAPGENENDALIDMLFNFIRKHGRPKTIMVRDEFNAATLKDFCGKIGVNLVHSEGMPAIDKFARDLPDFMDSLSLPR
jgi:hypothetical protein